MIKLIAALSALLLVTTANAQTWAERAESFKDTWAQGSDTVRLLLGAQSGANHIGLDYEHRMGPIGVGTFLLQANESAALQRSEYMTFGIVTPVHLIDRTVFDVYVGPGINITQQQDVALAGGDDVTTFGGLLKFGMMYYCNKTWSWGLDFMKIHNLNESEAPDEDDLVNFGLGYSW